MVFDLAAKYFFLPLEKKASQSETTRTYFHSEETAEYVKVLSLRNR